MFDAGGGEAGGELGLYTFFVEEAAAVDESAGATAVVSDAEGVLGVGFAGAEADRAGAAFEKQHDVSRLPKRLVDEPVKDDIAAPIERRVEFVPVPSRPFAVFFPISFHIQECSR